MARQPNIPSPTLPTISKEEGKRRFAAMIQKASTIVVNQRVAEHIYKTWSNNSREYIKQTFGSDSSHLRTFDHTTEMAMVYSAGSGYEPEPDYDIINAQDLEKKVNVLKELISTIEFEAGFVTPQQQFDFWVHIHPEIITISKKRFEDEHFADSVEAAFKHVNIKVKELVFQKTRKDLDGASLMNEAFSPNHPIIALDDVLTTDGKNIQQGYMQIFAGSMTGIRNPKAHGNIQIDSDRAIHFLFLASLLMKRLDARKI